MAASDYMNEQWAHMRHVSEASATTPALEDNINHRPSWEPTPPTVTVDWKKSITRTAALRGVVSSIAPAHTADASHSHSGYGTKGTAA